MSATDHDRSGPIDRDGALARALDTYAVPELPAGFADRVLAAAETRAAPLPELRRAGAGGGAAGRIGGWRLGRRIALGAIGFGALATAAAATGLLERAGFSVPPPEKVWASITGKETTPEPAVAASPPPADPEPVELAAVRIEGPIDTPEELGEAFRRIDEVRHGRITARREAIDRRIDEEIERRRAAGLPVPTPDEEARFRQRIDEQRARREGVVGERIEARREEMRRRIEAGEALTGEDIIRPLRDDARAVERRERIERLRRMTPQQRREALRQLPPEQRQELIEAWRQRREERLRSGVPAAVDVPAPESAASQAPAAEESAAPLSPPGTPAEEGPR